jgi:hypothetical protein
VPGRIGKSFCAAGNVGIAGKMDDIVFIRGYFIKTKKYFILD